MSLVAVMLNLRADALTAAYSGNNQRGRPTTGSKAAHCLSPTGATAIQLTQPALSSHPRWNKLRLHRMTQSIAQLTLCQVTGEEIDPVMSSCCYLVQVTQVTDGCFAGHSIVGNG